MVTAVQEININGLVRRQYLLILITLAYNSLIINNKDVLFNTEAGVYTLIKKNVIKNLWEKMDAKRINL